MTRLPLIALLLLGACAAPDRGTMLPGISEPRDRFVLTVHRRSPTCALKCLEMVAKASVPQAVFTTMLGGIYHACARVARDRDLKPGQTPWCEVCIPDDDPELIVHEVFGHCQGWDH